MGKVKILIISNGNFLERILKDNNIYYELLNSKSQRDINAKIKSLQKNKIDIIFLDTSLIDEPVSQFFEPLNNFCKDKSYSHPPIFVVYEKSSFDVRAEIWKQPIIGFAKKGSAEANSDIKKIITDIENRKSHEKDPGIEIGSVESVAPDLYERFKFISLTAGRMREFMLDFKNIINNITHIKNDDSFCNAYPNEWLDYMHYTLHPPEDKQTQESFEKLGKRLISKTNIFEDAKLTKKFEEIFCDEERVKNEKLNHILIEGETGTGKSLIAEMIKQFTCAKRFEKVTCTNISTNLLEGELFGHMKGSFTGAYQTKAGRAINAYNGIIFLDEIGDMDPYLQAKILTFLDNGRIEPIGWIGPTLYIPSLVVAATNKDLLNLAKARKFREDLYYRFAQRITIPPLRERKGDTDLLVDFILQNPDINPLKGETRTVSYINAHAIEKLKTHIFPGNYRELEYILLDAVKKAKRLRSSVILPEDIVFHEPSIEESDAVFVVPKKTEGGEVKILLQWDVYWKQYFFIGGRFERNKDVTLEDTARREITNKIKIDKGYRLTPISDDLSSLQYPKQYAERRLYQFHVFGIEFERPVFDWLIRRACILASISDVVRGDYKGKRISETVREVWEKLSSGIEELPESFKAEGK
ncbi:MAG: sigma 54-interacting transcriptional regulator [Nitrospirae bacterium]|nr:sigma 54-interacting transcriptional regulator [Nitrospirota bacterium]